MQIGIVGKGIVGGAVGFGMERLGHTVLYYDVKLYDTSLDDLIGCDIIYLCLPTPTVNGKCDISIVEQTVGILYRKHMSSIVAIKSTVIPGTTDMLQKKYQGMKLCAVPEFLRERHAVSDFVERQHLLAVGTTDSVVAEAIIRSHGEYPQKIIRMMPTQAELLKYFHNTINTLRIGIANEFFDICEKMGVRYDDIRRALLCSTGMPDAYLHVNQNCRGWSSICFNKDIPALIQLASELNLDLPILRNIVTSNDRLPKTPFSGTRE